MSKAMASTSGDDIKSSAHVWSDQEDLPIDDSPPAYSGTNPTQESSTIAHPTTTSSSSDLPTRPLHNPSSRTRPSYNPLTSLSQWSQIPWHRYVVPDATVSPDRTTITTTNTNYLTSQQSLLNLITSQSDLPPMPELHIKGEHIHNIGSHPKIDFNIVLNLSYLLNLSRPPRWRNRSTLDAHSGAVNLLPSTSKVTGPNAAYLHHATRQFHRDKSDRKSLVLTRSVENLPTDIIEGLVRNLVASLNYRGKVTVDFPVHGGRFVVQKKPTGTGAAVGGWFMNALGLSPDIKYEVLERIWGVGVGEGGENEKEVANALVKEWWNAWAPVVRDTILVGRVGKVSVEDWIETQMGWRPKAKVGDWGADYA